MALPAAVQRQVDEANRLQEEMTKGPETPATDTPAPETPVEEPVAEPSPVAETPAPDPVIVETPAEDTTDYKALYEKEKARADALKGKYDKEVPRLHEQLRSKPSGPSTDELLQEIRDLKKQIAEKPASEPAAPKEVSDAQKATQSLYPEVYTAIKEMIAEALSNFRPTDLEREIESVKTTVKESATSKFYKSVSKAVADKGGDMAVLNDDPEFAAWLGQREGRTKYTKRAFFDQAVAELDDATVSEYFIEFLQSKSVPSETPPEVPPAPKLDKTKLTAPPPSLKRGEVPAGKKTYTRAEVNEFYKKAARGLFPLDVKIQMENDINAAARENRIVD